MRKLINYVSSSLFVSFDNLQKVVNEWNKPGCALDDGRPKISALDAGIIDAVDGNWDVTLDKLNKLEKRYPKSAILALAEAEYWERYAWHARGSGVASTVSPEGWKLFKQRLQTAEQILKATKSYSSNLPVWYLFMINIEFELDRPNKAILTTFNEAVNRYKLYYPVYFAMVHHLLPKWGGNWKAVDNYTNWVVKYTKPQLGDLMYVRIYWSVYERMWERRTFFAKTEVSWKKMKTSFETMLRRNPKSYWDMNYYAKFACLAGDRQTFLFVRKKIAQHIFRDVWYRLPIELCDEKFSVRDRQYRRTEKPGS